MVGPPARCSCSPRPSTPLPPDTRAVVEVDDGRALRQVGEAEPPGTGDDPGRVDRVELQREDGKRCFVRARWVVLAAGGIENLRPNRPDRRVLIDPTRRTMIITTTPMRFTLGRGTSTASGFRRTPGAELVAFPETRGIPTGIYFGAAHDCQARRGDLSITDRVSRQEVTCRCGPTWTRRCLTG